MSLSEETCSACRPDATPASEEEIRTLRAEVSEWKLVEEDSIQKLQRQFSFDNFVDALAFTNRVGELAERVGHHPALLTEWGRVTVTWWTHKIGGLYRNDFICAAHTDALTD